MNTFNWYAREVPEVEKHFSVHVDDGLTEDQVKTRLGEYGYNQIPEPKGKSIFTIFISQFLNPLIYVLLAAGAVSVLAGETQDAFFIFAIILINAALGTYQEWQAENSAAALKKLVKVKARVRRAGKLLTIESELLVPGDCVLLESGVRVPADVRLADVNDLSIEEGLLTGESQAVTKTTAALRGAMLPLGDQVNMAFASTTVQRGRGMGIVVATSASTEIGKIAQSLKVAEPEKPPLVTRMESFSKKISWMVIVACLVLGMIGLWRDMPLAELFFFLVAVGVSAIPEGLPVALTVALSIGTRTMARRNVIVRKLPAVEGLGSCTLIASDKTGTLTVDQQTVKVIWLPGQERFTVTGQGYNGDGAILQADGTGVSVNDPDLHTFMRSALLCNEGALHKNEQGWEHSGDAVDVALRAMAYKTNQVPAYFLRGSAVSKIIPYESERKYSAAFFENGGEHFYACKGALEVIGPRLRKEDQLTGADQVRLLAQEGYRVLAVAHVQADGNDQEERLPPLRLVGLVGLIDPLRPEAKRAVAQCHEAGIEVVMVTGDHPITAFAIARDLGIVSTEDQLISGVELATIKAGTTEDNWYRLVQHKRVFARVNPLQKLEIVNAMKRAGHFVAVTGDGVNDAPALRMAHIGIAMGSGTDITKESSSIIIADNNFASIVAGVEEGRITFNNLRKIIYMLLSTGLAEILTVALAMIFQLPLPFVAVQLLWLNLVTNGIQDISLAFERSDTKVLQQPPRKPGESIFDPRMIRQILLSGFTTTLLCFGTWYYCLHQLQYSELQSRSIVLMLMVLIQNFHVLNCRSETTSIFRMPVSANYLAVIAMAAAQLVHLAASYVPFVAEALRIQVIPWGQWFVLLGLSLSILVVMEVYKAIAFRHS